jgi:uncharacterized protein (TIGR04255 family)
VFIDIDSYWNAQETELPPFTVPEILAICDQLHEPTRDLFEKVITDKLRDEVLRVERIKP